MIVDFRSDTFTKPDPGMLEAMLKAAVGDDVFGEDPSVNKLEEMTADLFGMEAALYCPTGTMSNQIAIKLHTQPGDEVICHVDSHVYQYEGGGIAFNSGCQVRLLQGNFGRINASQVLEAINPDDVHKARTSLVCIENTSNRGGGSCYTMEEIEQIAEQCRRNNLKFHLDGARLFNALIAKNQSPKDFGKHFDTISVCLNKGLGCPMGSMLIGTREMILRARRIRKVFGGGMRQAGYMAACGIYALEFHIERLREDHLHARLIGEVIEKKSFTESVYPIETNIIIANLVAGESAHQLTEKLKEENILALPISPTKVRLVLHLGVSRAMVDHTISRIEMM